MSTPVGGERGAIAILTAILAFLLFGVSALAVDLGNMYARSGDAQKAADLAALAGANALVDQDDWRAQPSAGFEDSDADRAMEAAHAALESNPVFSDGSGSDIPGENDPIWVDSNESNGKIDVDVDTMRVTVVVPPRTVRFGLAAVFGIGQSTVSARAVAEVRAPGQLLPFYLPDELGCRTESQFIAAPPRHVPGGSLGGDCAHPGPLGNLGLFTPSGAPDLWTNVVHGLSGGLGVGDTVTTAPAGLDPTTADNLKDALAGDDGRLAADTASACADLRSVPGGAKINNDVLSCFIDTGYSIDERLRYDCDDFPTNLNPQPGPSLLPSVFDSPRFFFVPVIGPLLTPTGSVEAITEFRAVFLTDETQGGADGIPPSDATNDNGVDFQGQDLHRITVYAFCPDELPNAAEQGGNGFPWQPGLPAAIRLVE
jgi:hypothetical protein